MSDSEDVTLGIGAKDNTHNSAAKADVEMKSSEVPQNNQVLESIASAAQ